MPKINQTILDTVLGHLTLLFMAAANGDPAIARQAATQMLAAHNVTTEEELRLAAEIISFGLHALEALSQAAEPGLSPNRTIRLRGSAVSLSREAHKSQRQLDRLRRNNVQPQPQPAQASPRPRPSPSPSLSFDINASLVDAERQAKQIIARDGGGKWSQSFQKRETAKRMAETIRKRQAAQRAQSKAQAA